MLHAAAQGAGEGVTAVVGGGAGELEQWCQEVLKLQVLCVVRYGRLMWCAVLELDQTVDHVRLAAGWSPDLQCMTERCADCRLEI